MSTTRRQFVAGTTVAGGLAAAGVPLAGAVTAACATSPPPAVFDDGWQACVDSGMYAPRTHLFLDDLHIERLEGVRRVLQHPRRVGDAPVMRARKPWEGVALAGLRNSVLYDPHDKVFKFWYRCFDKAYGGVSHGRWAYATSPDGAHWERPQLGLVPFGGSTRNNLVHIAPTLDVNALLLNVVRDDRDADPERRFKAIGIDAHPVQAGDVPVPYLGKTGVETAGGLYVAYSADGLRWAMRPGWLMGMICRDGSILHGYDERIDRWVLWQRPSFRPGRGQRLIGVSYSRDFEHWTPPAMGLVTDDDDPPGFEFFELTTVASPDGGYIGLVGCSGWQGQGLEAGESMPQLVFARDPRRWTRVSRAPFMPQGPEGAFDEGVVMPMRPITIGDDVYLFYYAKNRGQVWGEARMDGKDVTTSSLGLAMAQRDRWVALAPTGSTGVITTSLVFFAASELRVNVRAEGGSVRAELQDFHGRPVEGYTLDASVPITSDAMDHVVTWRDGRRDLTSLIGSAVDHPPGISRAMRIRFVLERAELFAFSC